MSEPVIVHNTFVITRTYPKSPEQVFAALSDPAKKRRWYGESKSHETVSYELDFRIGGAERASYRFGPNSPFPGAALTNDGSHLEIVPNQRVVIASTMAMAGRRFSASLVTFELVASGKGTELIFTHQGAFFEHADGPAMREQGWRLLLDALGAELAA